MVSNLVYSSFRIFLDWTKFNTKLIIFHKKGYHENFIDMCFKKLLDNIHLVKENIPIVGKESIYSYPSLQQAIKDVLNCCKVEIVFKCQTRLSSSDLKSLYQNSCLQISGWFLKWFLLWREYQVLRYKTWVAHRCITSYWKESQTNQ